MKIRLTIPIFNPAIQPVLFARMEYWSGRLNMFYHYADAWNAVELRRVGIKQGVYAPVWRAPS